MNRRTFLQAALAAPVLASLPETAKADPPAEVVLDLDGVQFTRTPRTTNPVFKTTAGPENIAGQYLVVRDVECTPGDWDLLRRRLRGGNKPVPATCTIPEVTAHARAQLFSWRDVFVFAPGSAGGKVYVHELCLRLLEVEIHAFTIPFRKLPERLCIVG